MMRASFNQELATKRSLISSFTCHCERLARGNPVNTKQWMATFIPFTRHEDNFFIVKGTLDKECKIWLIMP